MKALKHGSEVAKRLNAKLHVASLIPPARDKYLLDILTGNFPGLAVSVCDFK